jgi:hypothetical protein
MAPPFGVTVKTNAGVFLYTTSQDAENSARRIGVLIEQQRKRIRVQELLLSKTLAAVEELKQREADGKARRPARKQSGNAA